MIDINKKLTSLANNLDAAKLFKAADIVDDVNKQTIRIVQAQYVGSTGYAIRNQRCWSNCYRQKRTATNKSAQEIWFECHKEYLASFGKDESDWDKYADQAVSFVKTANNKHVWTKEDNIFNGMIQKKVSLGTSLPVAVFESIDEIKANLTEDVITASQKMAKLAETLHNNNKKDLALQTADLANELLKISQFNANLWNPKNWLQWGKEQFNSWTGNANNEMMKQRLQRALLAVQNLRTRFPNDMSQLPLNQQQQINQQMAQLQQNISAELNVLGQMSRNSPSAGQIYQQIMVAFNNFANTPLQDMQSRRKQLDNLANVIANAAGQTNNLAPTQETRQNVVNPQIQQASPAASPQPAPVAQNTSPVSNDTTKSFTQRISDFLKQPANLTAVNAFLKAQNAPFTVNALSTAAFSSWHRKLFAQALNAQEVGEWLLKLYNTNSSQAKNNLKQFGVTFVASLQVNPAANAGKAQPYDVVPSQTTPSANPPVAKVPSKKDPYDIAAPEPIVQNNKTTPPANKDLYDIAPLNTSDPTVKAVEPPVNKKIEPTQEIPVKKETPVKPKLQAPPTSTISPASTAAPEKVNPPSTVTEPVVEAVPPPMIAQPSAPKTQQEFIANSKNTLKELAKKKQQGVTAPTEAKPSPTVAPEAPSNPVTGPEIENVTKQVSPKLLEDAKKWLPAFQMNPALVKSITGGLEQGITSFLSDVSNGKTPNPESIEAVKQWISRPTHGDYHKAVKGSIKQMLQHFAPKAPTAPAAVAASSEDDLRKVAITNKDINKLIRKIKKGF